jgi:CRP-like cAMP-binding protein
MRPARPTPRRTATLPNYAGAFSVFPPDAAASLRRIAVHRCWRNGEIVLPRGHLVPAVMSIVRGRLRITAASEEGHEVFFRWYMPGEVMGLVSAVAHLPFPVDAVAHDDCETLNVEREALMAMLQADPQIAVAAARVLARHAWDVVNLVTARTEQSLTARVLGVLRHLAVLNGQPCGGGVWRLSASQQDIASAAGASRQRVNAELRTLERSGHIELGYGHVIVHGCVPPETPEPG